MANKSREIVLARLKELLDELPKSQLSIKVYHMGFNSYSWKEIASEVEHQSEFGKAYVADLKIQARKESIGIKKFLERTLT